MYSSHTEKGITIGILILVICSYAPYGCHYGFTMAGSLDLYCIYAVTCLNLQMHLKKIRRKHMHLVRMTIFRNQLILKMYVKPSANTSRNDIIFKYEE